jgi:hypothetical protein
VTLVHGATSDAEGRLPHPYAGRRSRPAGQTYCLTWVMPMRWSAAAACGDSCPVTGTRRAPDGQAIGASGPSAAYSGVGVFELGAGWAGASCRAPRRADFFAMCTSVVEADRSIREGYTRLVLIVGSGPRPLGDVEMGKQTFCALIAASEKTNRIKGSVQSRSAPICRFVSARHRGATEIAGMTNSLRSIRLRRFAWSPHSVYLGHARRRARVWPSSH